MQKIKRHILSTRPLPDALVQEAAAQNIVIDVIPFIQTKPVIDAAMALRITQLFQKPITAVFTSKNAVTAVAKIFQKPKNWKVYCINNTTGRLITELFKILISGMAPNAATLADQIIRDGIKEVYFFTNNMRRDALPEKLRAANIIVQEIVVYETAETPVPVTVPYNGVLFFSPSAVHSFFSINKISAATQVFAIGYTTAETILKYTTNPVLISDNTDTEDLVRQVIQHFGSQKMEDNA